MRRRWVTVIGRVGVVVVAGWAMQRVGERRAQADVEGAPVTVTGEVFEPDGHPARGCEVRLFYRAAEDMPRLATTTTDPQGRFAFTVGVQDVLEPVYVLAWREGLALDWHGLIPGNPALLQLGAEPEACAGVVTDLAGAPVAGARVELGGLPFACAGGSVNLRKYPDHPLATVTDAQGRFRIGGLPEATFAQVVAVADGHARRTVYAGKDMDPLKLSVQLAPEATIRGRVMHDGRPVAGVGVWCRPEDGTKGGGDDRTVTDEQGIYTLHHLWFGTFIVIAEGSEGLAGNAIEGVTLGEGEHRTIGDIRLTPGGVVRGRATEEGTGNPVAGVRIYASGPAQYVVRPVFTDAEGRYALRLPPGEDRVRVLSPYHPWTHYPVKDDETQTVTLSEGQTLTDIDFPMKPSGWFFGRLRLDMAISFLPPEISAYEPVVARVSLTTVDGQGVGLADSGDLNWRIQVRDREGNLLAITPRQLLPADLVSGTEKIPPGGALIQDVVISALYTFAEPGEYEVRIQRLRLVEHFPIEAEASGWVTVVPFDKARLEARCRELAAMKATDPFPWFLALCSVRHDVVLPYLEEWVENTVASHAIFAIDSPAARAKFEALAARQDHVGKVARHVREDAATRPRYRWPWGVLGRSWSETTEMGSDPIFRSVQDG